MYNVSYSIMKGDAAMDYELMVKDLIIGILPYFKGDASRLEELIKTATSGYSAAKVKEHSRRWVMVRRRSIWLSRRSQP